MIISEESKRKNLKTEKLNYIKVKIMKKSLLAVALLAQVLFVSAQVPGRVKSDNVNLYRQPGKKADVVKVLNSNDEVMVIRKFNDHWSIVQVGTETGYIVTANLAKMKKQQVTESTAKN